jgi:hypothetical protein
VTTAISPSPRSQLSTIEWPKQDGLAQIPEDDDGAEGVRTDNDQDGEDGVYPEPKDRQIQELGFRNDLRRFTSAQSDKLAALVDYRIEVEETGKSRPACLVIRT